MLHYIIQTIVFQLFFLIIYDLFLKRETFFNWNRAYLIVSALLSLLLPFIKLESFRSVVPSEYAITITDVFINPVENGIAGKETPTFDAIVANTNSFFTWDMLFYIGCFCAAMFFIYKLSNIILLIYKYPKTRVKDVVLIQLLNSRLAFSFFNYIFIGEQIKDAEKEAIMAHEHVHVKQKHSIDLLLFEILRILFWFNPLVYMYQNRIAVLHEFIADSAAVKVNKTAYYENLLAQVFQVQNVSFINPFFKKSLIKKRIIMLNKSKSKQIKTLKYALLIPMVVGMLVYTSCNQNSEDILEPKKEIAEVYETPGLEKYTNSFKIGAEVSDEYIEKSKMASKFRSENKDYVSWILIDMATGISTSTTHHISEKAPEDYKEIRVALPEGGDILYYRKVFNQDFAPVSSALTIENVDTVPVISGCEMLNSENEKKSCLQQNLNTLLINAFPDGRLKEEIKDGKTEYSVSFIVGKDGVIKDIKPGGPYFIKSDDDTIKAVKTFPTLTPGTKNGKPVEVKMYIRISSALFN